MFISEKCKTKIEEFEIRESKYQSISLLANQMITGYDEDIVNTKQEIETLRGLTVTTQDAVDNINLILNNSGFESFEIKEKELVNNISQYYLKRPNTSSDDPNVGMPWLPQSKQSKVLTAPIGESLENI